MQNLSGFDSNVIGAMLGLLGPLYAYGPPHWLLNMAEDVEDPSRAIPIALLAQQAGNVLT
jgi:amino acid transporter